LRISSSHPFLGDSSINFIIFFNFFDYVITAHAVGHDIIGQPDMKNEISRFDKPGTEVRFTLRGTDKKLRPRRCALISYFFVVLRNSAVGNTLKTQQGPFQ